jgi:hypothetical protein
LHCVSFQILSNLENLYKLLKYISNLSLEDSESESDVQDQQPTEATDDSKYPFSLFRELSLIIKTLGDTSSQIQTTTVNIIDSELFFSWKNIVLFVLFNSFSSFNTITRT